MKLHRLQWAMYMERKRHECIPTWESMTQVGESSCGSFMQCQKNCEVPPFVHSQWNGDIVMHSVHHLWRTAIFVSDVYFKALCSKNVKQSFHICVDCPKSILWRMAQAIITSGKKLTSKSDLRKSSRKLSLRMPNTSSTTPRPRLSFLLNKLCANGRLPWPPWGTISQGRRG